MAIVDYAEWFRQQMQRQGMGGMPGAVGSLTSPGTYQPEYQRQRFGEIDREMWNVNKDIAVAGAKGYATGGEVGAVINAAIAAAPYAARAGRRSWDAAKEGDVQGVKRALAPFSPAMYVSAKLGNKQGLLGKYTDPMYYATKTIQELFGGPRTKIEEKRWDRLKDYGFQVPKWAQGDRSKKFDVYRKELPPDFVGYDKDGNWVNNKFARTRNEADLTATDISQSAAMYENFGKVYEAASQQAKDAMAALALQNNLIQEQKGTLNIAWNDDLYQKAADILMQDKQAQNYMAKQPKEYVSPFVFNQQTGRFEDTRTQGK